jgi:uncharacterized lipoprotein YddW (UPF0748 family)
VLKWTRIFLISLTILEVIAIAGSAAEIDQEARAFWVVRNRITTPEKIQRIVNTAKDYNFNTLIVQIHGRGDAYYHSKIDPRAEDLADQDPTFDPLASIVELGHEAGLEVHAWINAIYIWSEEHQPVDKGHVLHRHPEWMMWDDEGRSVADYSRRDVAKKGIEGVYVDPSRDEVLDYLHSIYMEVATNYPVDGIHFDYIRYPGVHFGYSDAFCRQFSEQHGVDPRLLSDQVKEYAAEGHLLANRPILDRWNYLHYAQWNKAKADCITELVRRVSRSVKEFRPQIKVSAAVFPDPGTAYWRVSQDWRTWQAEGLVDIVCPMIYSGEPEVVAKRAAAAMENANGNLVYAGLGAWQKEPSQIVEEIGLIREVGVHGMSLFAFWPVAEEEGYLEILREKVFPTPAAIPPLPGGTASGGR